MKTYLISFKQRGQSFTLRPPSLGSCSNQILQYLLVILSLPQNQMTYTLPKGTQRQVVQPKYDLPSTDHSQSKIRDAAFR